MHYSRHQPQSLLLVPPTSHDDIGLLAVDHRHHAPPAAIPPCRHIDALSSTSASKYRNASFLSEDENFDGEGYSGYSNDDDALLHRFLVGTNAVRSNGLYLVEYYDGMGGVASGSEERVNRNDEMDGAEAGGLYSSAHFIAPGGEDVAILSLQCCRGTRGDGTGSSDEAWMVTRPIAGESITSTGLYRLPGAEGASEGGGAYGYDAPRTPEPVVLLPSEEKRDGPAAFVEARERGGGLSAYDDERGGGDVREILAATLHSQTQRAVLWDVSEAGAGREKARAEVDEGTGAEILTSGKFCAQWDPHNEELMGVCTARGVGVVDWRCAGEGFSQSIFSCHRYGITDLDYNPNRPHVVSTGGMDGLVKFWDLRGSDRGPIRVLKGHTHWISSVHYNRFHDQLVLTGGTDSLVNLWRVSSISSAPLLELDDDDVTVGGDAFGTSDMPEDATTANPSDFLPPRPSPTGTATYFDTTDMCVGRMEHQESVVGVSWSKCDAWLYASLSYDGQVVVNHVPSKEKYKILL